MTIRFFEPGTLLMLTSRTIFGTLFMQPDRDDLNDVITGVVAMAQRKHAVTIHGLAFLGNHFHIIATGRDPAQIAEFMALTKAMIARRVNQLRGRTGQFWEAPYDMQLISHEPEAQIAQLAYVLAHGAKEGLVERPEHWPGVTSARQLLAGGEAEPGTWVDRTAASRTTAAKRTREPERYAESLAINLTPLPCLFEAEPEERREALHSAVQEVVERSHRHPAKFADLTDRSDATVVLAGLSRVTRPRTKICRDWQRAVLMDARERRSRHIVAVGNDIYGEMADRVDAVRKLFAEASANFRAGQQAQFPPWTFPPGQPMAGAYGQRFGPQRHAMKLAA